MRAWSRTVPRTSVMSVGGWDRGKASPQLEGLAELDLGVGLALQRATPGRGRIFQGAPVADGVEMGAVVAREAERVPGGLEAELLGRRRSWATVLGVAARGRRSWASPLQGDGHGRRRSRATTASAWLVWGNISKTVIDVGT
jgi:hypothetical protein